MHRPNKQGDLVLDLDPIFCNSTTPPIPEDATDQDDTLCMTQTTKRTTQRDSPSKTIATLPSTQENNFKIKDILAGYVSGPDQNSLANQYKTVDHRENITTEYTDTKSDDSMDLSRPFIRVNSAKSVGYKSKGVNSSFVAAYQADLREKVRTPQRSTSREVRKSVTNTSNLERFTPVSRVQRPHSSHGSRPVLNRTASKSREINLNESLIEREYGVRMETAPDREYASESTAKKLIVERKDTVDYFKKQGLQKYENKVLRQELERQMKMMENRVKRLTREDQMIAKNIKKTGDIMEKAVANKQRFQDEIMQAELAKQKKIQEQQKAREKIKEEKVKRENNLKSRLTLLQREKTINASQVKAVLQQDTVRMNEAMRKEEEKKQKVHQATVEFEKLLKLKKQFRQVENKWHTDENHIKFLQEEHMKTLEIETRIQDLARKEEQLIDQIRVTQQIQVKADNMMKRVMATKVGKARQMEFR